MIVATPSGGSLWFAAQLPAAASAGEILAAAGLGDGSDALHEVNALRAARGMRPYIRDDGLTQAARACAAHRAERRIAGHVNDFAFLPAGSDASCTGCAAFRPEWGFGACAIYENHTYCGAAWVIGSDGLRYCHAFYR